MKCRIFTLLVFFYLLSAQANPEQCKDKTNKYSRSWCYHDTAIKMGRKDLCDFVELPIKISCQGLAVMASKNEFQCNEFMDTSLAAPCLQALRKDKAYCDGIDGDRMPTQKSDCYHWMAWSTKDPTLCEKITALNSRSLCYRNMALLLKKIELCQRVGHDIYWKIDCERELAKKEELIVAAPAPSGAENAFPKRPWFRNTMAACEKSQKIDRSFLYQGNDPILLVEIGEVRDNQMVLKIRKWYDEFFF